MHENDINAKIAERAYSLWLLDGCPNGKEREHWLQAEREILVNSDYSEATIDSTQPEVDSSSGLISDDLEMREPPQQPDKKKSRKKK